MLVLVGWDSMEKVGIQKMREGVALLIERKDCVAWSEFFVVCELLERAGHGE